MKRAHAWAWAAGLAVVVLGGLLLAAWTWLPNGDDLARRIETEAEARLGVAVQVGGAHWSLVPVPVVVVTDLRTQQEKPITIGRVAVYPKLRTMLAQRRLQIERVEVDDASVDRQSMRAFRGRQADAGPGGEQAEQAGIPLERFVFRNLTWVSYSGIPVAYDGEVTFDPQWRPRSADLRVAKAEVPATLALEREGDADRWRVRIALGGGTAEGHVALHTPTPERLELSGELASRNVEVQAALAAFNRRSPVSGRAAGRTVLAAKGETAGELARSLHTTSDLNVTQARILRLDLDKAIRTRGKEHDGQTPLDSLSGRMDTQNTENGTRFTYSNVQAKAGKYAARGDAVIYQRRLTAQGTLDLGGGVVSVPFTASGPVRKPELKIPKGIFAGAAIGTALLPGIGTIIGARIGSALGQGKRRESVLDKGDAKAAAPRRP